MFEGQFLSTSLKKLVRAYIVYISFCIIYIYKYISIIHYVNACDLNKLHVVEITIIKQNCNSVNSIIFKLHKYIYYLTNFKKIYSYSPKYCSSDRF